VYKRNKELEDIITERTEEIVLQNQALQNQADTLNETNTLMEERQQHIEEQSEEILTQRDQLSQLNATKDKLFSILAHDLLNPFNIILGYSELLVNDFNKLKEDKIIKFHKAIYKSAFAGTDLLNNILQWSRAQTGRITFQPEKLNLLIISDEIINLLESNAQQKDIIIYQQINPHIFVFADENMLKTIFRNLISNAIKFTPNNGTITLKANISIDQSYVEVAVSDTGVGIPESTIKNLFGVQNTISTKGTANETGTGLGLIICKEFVQKHKGKIWVQSQENIGSAFYFLLPCKSPLS
jgi:signal transduction histidine kinase